MPTRSIVTKATVSRLCGDIKNIKTTANTAATGVQQLSNALNQSVQEIEDILNDYPVNNTATIATSSWKYDSTSTTGFDYYTDISTTIDANDLPIVSVSLNSLSIATAAELCPVCQSMENKIRLYAKNVPSASITIGYFIIQGQAAS